MSGIQKYGMTREQTMNPNTNLERVNPAREDDAVENSRSIEI